MGIGSFAFAWTFHFMLMIWASVLYEAAKPSLASSYFDPKPFEQNGRIYGHLGVHLFRRALVWVGWEKISRKARPIRRDLEFLAAYERATRASEFNHLLIGAVVLGFCVYVAATHGWRQTLWLLLLTVPLHVYPAMVQRYNRPRVRSALDRYYLH